MTSSFNRIDGVWPQAPALAGYGPATVGVRTLRLTHPAQLDVTDPALPLRDRVLTVELWYPAVCDSGLTNSAGDCDSQLTKPAVYDTLLRDGVTPLRLHGRARRDAAAQAFASGLRSAEAAQGLAAFARRQPAPWTLSDKDKA